ncbi:winged helix-turn-helix domain-containing protein [Antarctobacter heliothermus]|uniref:TolB amino-terminal domain-containing protein n=1 Tax=Antarctobacter heliothermus TaxID=74033 RepID=A0A239CD03_9RHOB|nr:winged helix-turn-helix domain-containing protein [Antarctobacter heliothermus]SNS17990.1 TolB amino-terminal domain-containing protein [Antarctobacter heliothermus]
MAATTNKPPVWRFAGFVFDAARFELCRDGVPVKAEPQSLRLLRVLIENRDRVVTRADLEQDLWQGRAVSDWAISAAVKALRAVLDDSERQIIRTVHSRGFRFVAELTRDTAPETAIPAVLVRPFRCPESAAEDAYLVDGLTEDLITDLSRHPSLTVLSYNTSRALGGKPPPETLPVSHLVEGSLRRMGATMRITVAILDAGGDRQVWAERFDVTAETLLAAQDRIGLRVAEVLAPGAAPEPRRAGTRHAGAYDRYLQGRYAYFRYAPQAFAEALAHFEAAARLDPEFAAALAQQAYCRCTLHVFGMPGADPTLARAEALARAAIALDAQDSLGHARLGWVLGYLGRVDDCIASLEEALRLDPANAEVCLAYGETLNRLARPEQAEALLERAFALDSFHPPSWEFAKGHARVLVRDHVAAVAHFRSVLARVDRFIPARVQLVRALVEQGLAAEATAEVAKIREFAPKYSLAHAARMFPYPVAAERARLLDALAVGGLA